MLVGITITLQRRLESQSVTLIVTVNPSICHPRMIITFLWSETHHKHHPLAPDGNESIHVFIIIYSIIGRFLKPIPRQQNKLLHSKPHLSRIGLADTLFYWKWRVVQWQKEERNPIDPSSLKCEFLKINSDNFECLFVWLNFLHARLTHTLCTLQNLKLIISIYVQCTFFYNVPSLGSHVTRISAGEW